MSFQAYQNTVERVESARDTEYRLFGEVTRALMAAAEANPNDVQARMFALDWNRRLWSALSMDCSSAGNTLPEGVRAQIISLALWVNRHSSAVMRREETFQPLIDVNRSIMQGLRAHREAA